MELCSTVAFIVVLRYLTTAQGHNEKRKFSMKKNVYNLVNVNCLSLAPTCYACINKFSSRFVIFARAYACVHYFIYLEKSYETKRKYVPIA